MAQCKKNAQKAYAADKAACKSALQPQVCATAAAAARELTVAYCYALQLPNTKKC